MFQYILKNKHLYTYVFGVTYDEFCKILPRFRKQLKYAERDKYMPYEERKRPCGGGRKSKLETDENKLRFILFFYRI